MTFSTAIDLLKRRLPDQFFCLQVQFSDYVSSKKLEWVVFTYSANGPMESHSAPTIAALMDGLEPWLVSIGVPAPTDAVTVPADAAQVDVP